MRTWPSLLVVAAISPAMCATRGLPLGDAQRGQASFRSLECTVCHSVNGVGGAGIEASTPANWPA
jgi:cytochrome c2